MMFGGRLGVGELILIVGAALLFFGPSKLPGLGKSLGAGIKEFKSAVSEEQKDEQGK